MPVIHPAWLARNLTPISTAEVSVDAGVGGTVVAGQIEHGQPDGGADAAVVNVHDTGAIVLFAASLAPDTLTVYTVDTANAADGVNVAVRVPASYVVVP